MESFKRWAYERRIRRSGKGSFSYIGSDNELYIPITISNSQAKYKLNGIRINEIEDISYRPYKPQAKEEIIEYVKSRLRI